MRRERLFLEDILTATDAVAEFIRGQTEESFEGNPMLGGFTHVLGVAREASQRTLVGYQGIP
jgi:uncharacterized protein with HEPN domain